jgi:hypothetical protein
MSDNGSTAQYIQTHKLVCYNTSKICLPTLHAGDE